MSAKPGYFACNDCGCKDVECRNWCRFDPQSQGWVQMSDAEDGGEWWCPTCSRLTRNVEWNDR